MFQKELETLNWKWLARWPVIRRGSCSVEVNPGEADAAHGLGEVDGLEIGLEFPFDK